MKHIKGGKTLVQRLCDICIARDVQFQCHLEEDKLRITLASPYSMNMRGVYIKVEDLWHVDEIIEQFSQEIDEVIAPPKLPWQVSYSAVSREP